MTLPCDKCNGLCCRYFCFQIDTPDDYDEFEDIRWYLYHEGVRVHVDEDGDWYIQMDNVCKNLGEDNLCMIYDDRPLICRSYGDSCEQTGGDYGYQHEFETAEQLDAYAIKTLGQQEYHEAMIQQRAKLSGVSKREMKQKLMAMGRITPKGKRIRKKD
jgi:Fe-S-cluster containining protein